MSETTTIQVSKVTKERLRKMSNKGDSYDTVVEILLDEVEEKLTLDNINLSVFYKKDKQTA